MNKTKKRGYDYYLKHGGVWVGVYLEDPFRKCY